MAKAGLLEQNRLSGANRNTLIAGGIMANTAEIFNFPVPDAAQKEPRVADLDDGYQNMRANALTDAELRRKAADELSCMTARINRGEAIPEPVKQLPVMGGTKGGKLELTITELGNE